MENFILSVKNFLETPYVWAILLILGFFGITDWIKNLVLQFLKETGHNFKELMNDKALQSAFYKWCKKHYRQLPPWAKKLSNHFENIANKMGIRTRRRARRGTARKK